MHAVSAYHIEGEGPAVVIGPNSYTAGDWVGSAIAFLTACESDGPNDSRNGPAVRPGTNGLCTTGRNGVTGEKPPTTPFNFSNENTDSWTQLDVCSARTMSRNGDNVGPYATAGMCAAAVGGGRTDTIEWIGRLGVYQCTIPRDWEMVYDEYYAQVTIDGTPPYGAGNPLKDYSGHVVMFINEPVTHGSAQTDIQDFDLQVDSMTIAAHSCDTSPACNPATPATPCTRPYGPVVRIPEVFA